MTVYVVMAAVNYQGLDPDSLQSFTTRDDAVAYGKSLLSSIIGYDYYTIVQTTVN